jgi:hypothetical protein
VAAYNFEQELPVQIRIGAALYTIEWFEHGTIRDDDGERLLGQTDFEKHHIKLEREQTLQCLVDTVRHEITHASNDVYGVKDKMLEEEFTDRTTKAWNDIWIHNPKLVVWFSKAAMEQRKRLKLHRG